MHVVQSHPVPHTCALHLWRQGVAHLCKRRLQGLQLGKLLWRGVKGNANYGIHIGMDSISSYMKFSSPLEKYLMAAVIHCRFETA
jgi:hypothetical protein